MDPLSVTASLIAVLQISGALVSTLYEYRKCVNNASKAAARIIEELNSLCHVFESLLRAVESEESAEVSRLSTMAQLSGPNGELAKCRGELERLSAKLEPESGWRAMRKALIWPLNEGEVNKTLESLQRIKSTLQLALSTDQAVVLLAVHNDIGNLTRQMAASTLDARRATLLNWLSAPVQFPNHNAARKKRQPLTGDWFLTGKQYQDWTSSSSSFMWVYGIPGCGKSVLCSSIIEDISEQCRIKPSTAIAYYYFDFNDVGKRDVHSLAQALVAQLLVQCSNDTERLASLYNQIQSGIQHPSIELLLGLLRDLIQVFTQTFIVIDALDECSECEELMTFLETIHDWQVTTLHLLATSRQLPDIEETVVCLATDSLCLQESNIMIDIAALLQLRLSSDRKFQKWPTDVKLEIESTLLNKASGMFRWVVCQLDMLQKCVTLSALRKALTSLPKTLDETYERILTNIHEDHISDVHNILQFLAFSSGPISIPEIVDVLAIDWQREEPQFEPENRVQDPKDILSMCTTLVTVSEITDYRSGTANLETFPSLRLAHFSVKEYLVSNRIKASRASVYTITPSSANHFIAKTYLTYLLCSEFKCGHKGWITTMSLRKRWPLLESATSLWPAHVQALGSEMDGPTKRLILRFFNTRHEANGGNYCFWIGGLIPDAALETIRRTPPLYYAASYNMPAVVKLLLETTPKTEVDARGGRVISTPLHVACFRGALECVRLLLEAGADPNTTNNRNESCIFWPRRYNLIGEEDYKKIYDLLLQYGAEDTPATSPFVLCGKTAKEGLEDEHYEREYHRLVAQDKMTKLEKRKRWVEDHN